MNRLLYESLIKRISAEVKKALYEYDEFEEDGFTIRIYDRMNSDDREFILSNRKKLWGFFDDGYKMAGLDTFANSCYDERSLGKNASILKIAYVFKDGADIMVAASVYSAHQKGDKCVGITATTDDHYRSIGKEAVKYIIKQDIGLYDKFYWGMFSDAIQHYYEKFGGILIPNDYVGEFVSNAVPSENSEYDITIRLRDGREAKKVIYGFNSRETYDKIMAMEDKRVNDAIERLKGHSSISESAVGPQDELGPDYYVNVVNMFFEDRNCGYTDLTPTTEKILVDAKTKLEEYVSENGDSLDRDKLYYYTLAIDNAEDVLDTSTVMELHTL